MFSVRICRQKVSTDTPHFHTSATDEDFVPNSASRKRNDKSCQLSLDTSGVMTDGVGYFWYSVVDSPIKRGR
jgi:hypothetical protein